MIASKNRFPSIIYDGASVVFYHSIYKGHSESNVHVKLCKIISIQKMYILQLLQVGMLHNHLHQVQNNNNNENIYSS